MRKNYQVYGVKYNDELVYVGKSQYGMLKRRNQHKHEAYERNFTDDFHVLIREVGWDSLIWYVIEDCNSQEELSIKEKYYIKELKPTHNKQEKAFYIYALDGSYIGEFSNVYDTAKTLNMDARAISRCLHGDKNKSHGYIFTYDNDDIDEKLFKAKHPYLYNKKTWSEITQIHQLFTTGNYTKTKLAQDFAIDRTDVRNIVKFFTGGDAIV